MKISEAFAPSHITGFFEVVSDPSSLLLTGSRGAGVCLRRGVRTLVKVEKAPHPEIQISINGAISRSAEVSRRVIDILNSLFKEVRNFRISVEHHIDVPIGAGFGTSGSAALSLALALNEALGLGLSDIEAAQLAHIAEIECRTGLGTVAAEFSGGVEIRVRAGAPGICEIKHVPASRDHVVACLVFGALPTKRVLANDEVCRRINLYGGYLVNRIVKDPSIHNLLAFSRLFTEYVGLASDRIIKVLNAADEIGFTMGMLMFGEGVFTICDRDSLRDLLRLFRGSQMYGHTVVSEVDFKGARVIDG